MIKHLKRLEISGFKSFAKREVFEFNHPITAIVGPNGSGKSNVAEAFRFVLGEQSVKSLRGKKTEDLIFNGSRQLARTNRASVKLIFDNTDRFLDIDFEEVEIERVIHRDAQHFYYINHSQVRLRDIVELLAKARIGSTGHHIVSQGEADRILLYSAKEKKALVEDALGLRIYQMRKLESERKLEKTTKNIDEAALLRREIAPHLSYLAKQVEKINERETLEKQLISKAQEFLKREEIRLNHEKEKLAGKRTELAGKVKELEEKVAKVPLARTSENPEVKAARKALAEQEQTLEKARLAREKILLEIARHEAAFEALKRYTTTPSVKKQEAEAVVPWRKVQSVKDQIVSGIQNAKVELAIDPLTAWITERFSQLDQEHTATPTPNHEKIEVEKEKLQTELKELRANLSAHEAETIELNKARADAREALAAAENTAYAAVEAANEERQALHTHKLALESLESDEARQASAHSAHEQILEELAFAAGRAILQFRNVEITNTRGKTLSDEEVIAENSGEQNKRRREIERLIVKVEEMKVEGGEDVIQEHQRTLERDQLLEKEIEDLKTTSRKLRGMISELDQRIDTEFKNGLESINTLFGEFFGAMFQGGHARLVLVELPPKKTEDGEVGEAELGLEIQVDMPRKRIKSLEMLSGGERSLTSTALIFAMGQVNPPPFIILDETDAALDEANSDRYGEMIEKLSDHSQLILITHNRNTMARAHALYGVTMGPSGASRLLSVDLEQAQAQAAR